MMKMNLEFRKISVSYLQKSIKIRPKINFVLSKSIENNRWYLIGWFQQSRFSDSLNKKIDGSPKNAISLKSIHSTR